MKWTNISFILFMEGFKMKIETTTIKTFCSDWEQACYDMGIEPHVCHGCLYDGPLFGPEADEAMKRFFKKPGIP